MAHAVSGSAYSAKGGNLKFADVVRERFRGPAFGQDFTTWLDEVLLGFETANISESSQVTHLVAFLESACACSKSLGEAQQPQTLLELTF